MSIFGLRQNVTAQRASMASNSLRSPVYPRMKPSRLFGANRSSGQISLGKLLADEYLESQAAESASSVPELTEILTKGGRPTMQPLTVATHP